MTTQRGSAAKKLEAEFLDRESRQFLRELGATILLDYSRASERADRVQMVDNLVAVRRLAAEELADLVGCSGRAA